VVYKNRWMTVREDKVMRADGSAGIYGVVEKPDFAVIVALGDACIYLVEQYRYPVQGRYWELPQGSWEGQHLDPLALATAELRQETGLVAATMTQVGRLFPSYGFCTQAYDLFLATDLRQEEQQLDPEEQGLICQKFGLRAVENMILDGTIRDAPTVAAFGLLRLKGLV